jgi:PTH1 family peptidyl-tRNA hydrolase
VVVGLGNPGPEHAGTRHNVGFAVADLIAQRHGVRFDVPKRMSAQVAEVRWRSSMEQGPVVLAKPQTYMNDSGVAVAQLVRRYGVEDVARVLVVHDELDLPPGRVKLKAGGGTAGHRGLASIVRHLRSDGFLRVRIGIGKPPGSMEGADFVLRRPGKAEAALLQSACVAAADAVEEVVDHGFESAMNRFNAR